MRERFAEHVAAKQLLRRNERIVVAFSAGPDSLALLLLLVHLRDREHYQLAVAHLDHALRPDSGLEAEHVRGICEQLGLPCFQERTEVAVLAGERGLGIEEAGRAARYDFLRCVAKRFCATAIVFGHQADDQVEQFWMRSLRGSSPASLAGMPEVRELSPGLRLVRPLLPFFRNEIEAFLAEQSWVPYQDLDNFLPQFVRNKIRHRLIPLLDDLQPGWKPRLLQVMTLLGEDEVWFQTQLDSEASRIGRWHLGLYSVASDAFRAWPVALRNRLILKVFQQPEYLAQTTEQPIQYRHLKLFEDSLATLREGALFSFPARRALQLHRQRLYFLRDWPPQPWILNLPEGEFDLALPWTRGSKSKLVLHCRIIERPTGGWGPKRDAFGDASGGRNERSQTCYMRLNSAFTSRKLRSRSTSDHLWNGGHYRKITDVFSIGSVPLPERWVYPVLEIQGTPAAIAGYLTSTEFRPATEDSQAVLLWLTMEQHDELGDIS